MKRAAQRLAQAINHRESILVHGDFDVDGSTASTLVKRFCRACSHDAEVWIPHRQHDGYGLSDASVAVVEQHQPDVFLTVDCGIADEGRAAHIEATYGCDVIITDHHLPQQQRPQCYAVVNPQQPECDYPHKGICGVAIAWKLCWATAIEICGGETISDRLREFLLDALSLVAIGTIADCMPMQDENRILVSHGLRALERTDNPGLRALLRQGRCNEVLDCQDIGWKISPLLNAAGRLESALINVELLCAESEERADDLIKQLALHNEERRRLTQILYDDLIAEVEDNPLWARRQSLVFAGDGWHPGVVGIVANRLCERYGKPTCVIAIADGMGRGSLRTVPGLNLAAALEACSETILGGGGHAAAAGVHLTMDQVAGFSDAFERFVCDKFPSGLELPALEHDATAAITELDQEFFDYLAAMGPFGEANPSPLLRIKQASFATRPNLFGQGGKHIRGAITDPGGGMREFLAWQAADKFGSQARTGCQFDLVVQPQLNYWRGNAKPQLVFMDGQAR